jgi:hypothetical protein
MKKLMLWMIAFATVFVSALQAQNVTGDWQGTLEAGPRKLRLVFTISLVDDKLEATLYSIDQPAPPMPASSVTKDGSPRETFRLVRVTATRPAIQEDCQRDSASRGRHCPEIARCYLGLLPSQDSQGLIRP